MKNFVLQIFTVLFLVTTIFAQSEEKKLIEIDDFGHLPLGELSARMDNFQTAFRNNKGSTALIKIYGGAENSLAFPHLRKAFYEAYFSSLNREIDKSKLIIQICEGNELRNQFFIVPQGVEVDTCEKKIDTSSKTTLIQSETLYPIGSADDYLGTKGVDKALSEALYKFIAELLQKSPESKVYVVGYAGRFFKPAEGKVEEEVVSKIESLKVNDKSLKQIKYAIVRRGIMTSRIIIMRGGHRNYSRVADIWFVPKGGEIPKPKPDYLPKKKLRKKK